jgi:ribosomal protein S18 acetylase RimI-like enzyme
VLTINRALPSESPAIAEVHVRSWQGAYCDFLPADYLQTICVAKREADWAGRLKNGNSSVLVARKDDLLVGWVNFGHSRDHDAPPRTAEIMAFYVSPPHWDKGIGRSLWLACLADLGEAGFHCVTLWVLENNRRGISFYESAGFSAEPGRMEEVTIGGVALTELRYVRPVCDRP